MLKKILWFCLGLAGGALPLWLIQARTGWPHPLHAGWALVWLGGFVLSILLLRLLDRIFQAVIARHPFVERLITGVVIGVLIFAGVKLHS